MNSISSIVGGGASFAEYFTDSAAARNAYNEQKRGLAQQRQQLKEDYNIDRLNQLTIQYDKGYLDRKIALQKEYEPELYQAGQNIKAEILRQTQQAPETLQSTQVAKKLFSENMDQDPQLAKLKQNVIQKANDLLALGGKLPPEYQAELLRAGVGAAATAGIKPGERSVGGVVSNVLGSAGEKLQQARTAEATSLAGTAQAMTESRAKILGSIFPSIQASEQAAFNRTAGLYGLTQAGLPQAGTGLTGHETLNFDTSGREAQRNIGMQLHNLKAQHDLEKARLLDNMINSQAGVFGASATGSYGDRPASGGGGGGGGSGGGMDMGSIMGLVGMFSDKNMKENIEKTDEEKILAKVEKLPVSNWEYKKDVEGVPQGRHTGPMAQDWDVLFGSGKGDARTIPIVDGIGVALASIKALVKQVKELKTARA